MSARLALTGLAKTFGPFAAVRDVSLAVEPGEIVCLLGPSGCGKSTTLRIAAGLERAGSGTVAIDGCIVDGPGVFVPPERRSVGLVFQDLALFPHLRVEANVAFGLQHLPRPERMQRVADALERVGLAHHARAWPHQLSGGEQQRVALARALAPRPRVLLMDEPFSSLDERLRDQVRDDTLGLLKAEGIATLLVTHDPHDALRVADRIALMREGRIVQTGTPDQLYDRPHDVQAAAFFSEINRLHGTVGTGGVETPFGTLPADGLAAGTRVEVLLRPGSVRLTADSGAPAIVIESRRVGEAARVRLVLEGGVALQAEVPARSAPLPGSRIFVAADVERVLVFPCADPACTVLGADREPGRAPVPQAALRDTIGASAG